MNSDKNFERLNESTQESAKRQDDIFNRIETIVQENPEIAKQYLQHLTQSSKWELYGRIYGKFAYITLIVAFLVAALVFSLNKMKAPKTEALAQQFVQTKPELYINSNDDQKYTISYSDDNKQLHKMGILQNFSTELDLKKENTLWQIYKNNIPLGSISFETQKISMEFDGKPYKIGTKHSFGNSKHLYFKINNSFDFTVPNSSDTTTRTVYRVVFGEKHQDTIIWNSDSPVEIMKSDNARGIVNGSNTNMHFVSHPNWKNSYAIEMTIGKLASDNLFVYYLFGNAFVLRIS